MKCAIFHFEHSCKLCVSGSVTTYETDGDEDDVPDTPEPPPPYPPHGTGIKPG